MTEFQEQVQKLEAWCKSENEQIIEELENGAINVLSSNNADGFSTYGLGVKVDGDDVSISENDEITISKY
jgi:molybdopterin converting factor small subunit